MWHRWHRISETSQAKHFRAHEVELHVGLYVVEARLPTRKCSMERVAYEKLVIILNE